MFEQARNTLVEWLSKQLIGPAEDGPLRISPLERYPVGVLHPIEPNGRGTDPASGVDSSGEDGLQDEVVEETDSVLVDPEGESQPIAQPVRCRRYVPPSSAGFSFFVTRNSNLLISVRAAAYVQSNDGRKIIFQRENLPEASFLRQSSELSNMNRIPIESWKNHVESISAAIDIRARDYHEGKIVTVTLCNCGELDNNSTGQDRFKSRVQGALFESHLECKIIDGELIEYPRGDPDLLSEEEQELELQYRHQHIFAVGHGAAVNWENNKEANAQIWTEFMPRVEVPLMTVDIKGGDSVLQLSRLAVNIRGDELDSFVNAYRQWVEQQKIIAEELNHSTDIEAANRLLGRMEVVVNRMKECIKRLRFDSQFREAFQLANQAMLDQMRQADTIAKRESDKEQYRWRPFQLAFLLTVMVSTIDEEDEARDVVDLIWFPTGGGKTEAYLGLIAFLIIWRRLNFLDQGAGTAAFMRYTLRLLTRQQFERAARLICALELIRRKKPDRLGNIPIDIGIWVGGSSSPNTFKEAKKTVQLIRNGQDDERQKLILERCCWCDTTFDPFDGYQAEDDLFGFKCNNSACEFGSREISLPCNVVDEALFDQPPSLLVATVDKFARFAWDHRTGVLFGYDREYRPPELVVQDELHLITGPLGSVAGLYESGFDTLIKMRGVRPKYVASTATIRMAKEQVRRLYARDLAVFPPLGLSHSNSYFAQTDRDRPGRLYVGYMAPMLDQRRCMAPIGAALLTAPMVLFRDDSNFSDLLDAWWTMVVYHGSLRAVGDSHNLFMTDVLKFGERLENELKEKRRKDILHEEASEATGVSSERVNNPSIAQLTSRGTAQENAKIFARLKQNRTKSDSIDAVLATNMVSVGLDVARLALMIVNGQPLTSAEYIQASSRVGRDEVPGLVLVNYFRSQARSLSHYETFRPYHESFYRFVEPSSVTPYTYQVRSRALHAALVIAVRHSCGELRGNQDAGKFQKDLPNVMKVVEVLKTRIAKAIDEPAQKQEVIANIDQLVFQWDAEAERCEKEKRQLSYKSSNRSRNADGLLFVHGESQNGLWATLNSMRNVELTGKLKAYDRPPSRSTFR